MSILPNLQNQLTTLLAGLLQQFAFAGSTAQFSTVQGISGAFTSLGAATGVFTSLSAASGSFTSCSSLNYYNGAGLQLTQTTAAFVGSLASTGAGTLLYNPITYRNCTPSLTGTSLVNSISIAPGWTRASYSVNLTIPPASTITAQCTFAGTVLPDSTVMQSNIAPTPSLGMTTAVTQSVSLSGFTHFVASATGAFTVQLSSSTGTSVLRNGSLELFQLS